MTPVFQTRLGVGGNCFQACVASVLNLALDDVPDFCNLYKDNWWNMFVDWLLMRGYTAVLVDARGKKYADWFGPGSVAIVTGESPRNSDLDHSIVVYCTNTGRKKHHDPAPCGGGISGPAKDIIFILPFVYGSSRPVM